MHDFYAHSRPMPLDQADGLRRMFAGRESQRCRVLPLVANPYVPFSGVVLDRLSAVLSAVLSSALSVPASSVLVVDASSASPSPHEMAALDLSAGIEAVSPRVSYLPAGGLPMAYVDTRGSAGGFIDAVQRAAPQAELILLHADAPDLARIFKRRAARPLLIGSDHPDSIKHAYAGAKLLAQRCHLLSFDLLLAASPQSPRAKSIAQSLAGCIETFLGGVLCHTALIDPAGDTAAPADAALAALLAAQLALDEVGSAAAAHAFPHVSTHAATHAATHAPATARPAFR